MNPANPRIYIFHGVTPFTLNEAYQTMVNWKAHKTWRKLDDDASAYQDTIKKIMAVTDLRMYGDQMHARVSVSMTLVFYIPRDHFITSEGDIWPRRYDCSNYIKVIEDAVFEYLGVDDSMNTCVTSQKMTSWDDRWHIAMILSTGWPPPNYGVVHHRGVDVTEEVCRLLFA